MVFFLSCLKVLILTDKVQFIYDKNNWYFLNVKAQNGKNEKKI